jgi:hypothetical protein
MPTIHDEIDELLTADLHDQLTDSERQTLHSHLVECADCRQLHKEYQAMNTALNDTFEAAKPELGFEQRVLSAFRQRVPDKGPGVIRFLVLMIQSKAVRVAAVAVVLLGLVQVGRIVTDKTDRDRFASAERVIVAGGNIPTASEETPREDRELASEFSESLGKKGAPFSQKSADAQVTAFDLSKIPTSTQKQRNTDEYASSTHDIFGKPASAVAGKLEDRGSLFSGGLAGRAPLEGGKDSAFERRAYTIAGIGNEPTYFQDSVAGLRGGLADSKPAKSKSEAGRAGAAPVATPSSHTETDQSSPNDTSQRKLIRNARTDLEVLSFQDTVEKITALAREAHGYVATSGSQKQENGKLRGEVVVKVLPDALDHFLEQLRGLGELKNQTIGTEDVSKHYFDTTARLDNARVMEQRLVEMLKKNTGKVSDLLQVEKELGRVREDIEKMQGELKFMDAQVQFATVTITLAERHEHARSIPSGRTRAARALHQRR